MKIAYLDAFAGIAGDMILGAFVSAGISPDDLKRELDKLKLGNVELAQRKVIRSGITAVKIDVLVSGETEKVTDLGRDADSGQHQGRSHRHHGQGHGRSYVEIEHLIAESPLSQFVRDKSLDVFRRIGEAESKIHDIPLEKIHFHEIGAVDSIVDIVGCALCVEMSGVDAVYTSPIRMGSNGFVETQHGAMPVPTPASIEVLKDYPVVFNDVPYELTTPTGAGIVKSFSKGVLKHQAFEIEKIGYGAGSRDLDKLPNLLRLVIGELKSEVEEDHVVMLETNMDDINPQLIPYVIEKLMSAGATDAFVVPVIMKKGRPGFMLTVLISESIIERISTEIFSQTTTLGLRIQHVDRIKIHREIKTALTSFGEVQVKEAVVNGKKRVSAEFEECRRIAESKGLPVAEVMQKLNAELNRE